MRGRELRLNLRKLTWFFFPLLRSCQSKANIGCVIYISMFRVFFFWQVQCFVLLHMFACYWNLEDLLKEIEIKQCPNKAFPLPYFVTRTTNSSSWFMKEFSNKLHHAFSSVSYGHILASMYVILWQLGALVLKKKKKDNLVLDLIHSFIR